MRSYSDLKRQRGGRHLISGAFPYINAGMMESLVVEVSEAETRKALIRMGSYQAPGLMDSYQYSSKRHGTSLGK